MDTEFTSKYAYLIDPLQNLFGLIKRYKEIHQCFSTPGLAC